jgi:hypothetical protein
MAGIGSSQLHEATPQHTHYTTIVNATLRFKSRDDAKSFAKAWTIHTLRGLTVSSTRPDGSNDVDVFDVTELEKKWIDHYVSTK